MSTILEVIEELSIQYPDISYHSVVKSGKEAEVHLIEADKRYFALKHYKSDIKFKSRKEYFTMSEILDSREGRAIKNNSRFGKRVVVSSWASREYEALKKLNRVGASVPEVYHCGSDYLVIEFIGEAPDPALQLYRVSLNDYDATQSFNVITDTIAVMWEAGFVHGDLSAYNILWHNGQTVVIDFPQVVMTANNSEAPAKLLRDVENISSYYKKYSIDGFEDRISSLKELAYTYWG